MTGLLNVQQEKVRFYKFMTVGVIGSIVDFGVMNLLSHLFSASLTTAGTISFICAVINNFLWNRHWTYPDSRSRPIARQLLMFFLVNLAGVAIRIPILHFLGPVLADMFSTWEVFHSSVLIVSNNFALAIAVGVVMLWNFFINRYWTYNDIDKVVP
jgi:putative flippase GtrA